MNLTGGIAWHWLAWRSEARWAPTSQAIEKWLLSEAKVFKPVNTDVQPSLMLIGASAGWMMSSQWLQQFARVDTYDIDPLAATLFKWRHGKALQAANTELHCHTRDALRQTPKHVCFLTMFWGSCAFKTKPLIGSKLSGDSSNSKFS
jgi:hypothetical protein